MSTFPGLPAVAAPTEQQRELVAAPDELRKMSIGEGHAGLRQRQWGFDSRLDPNVTFEEYKYWAAIERNLEREEARRYQGKIGGGAKGMLTGIFRTKAYEDGKTDNVPSPMLEGVDEKKAAESSGAISPVAPAGLEDMDAEWRTASRALRTAGWGGIFYLITTDILGWSQTPYVFANTGYGLGVGMFVLMGLAAGASGFMIWRTFLKLDSSRYPVVTFGDPFFRLMGPNWRHTINVLQSLQMFLSVAVVQLGQTGIIAQLGGSVNLCYIVCGVISLVVGIASGYMRALKHLGWFCNLSVWINVVTFIIICVAAARHFPDVAPQVQLGVLPKSWLTDPAPVKTFVGTPSKEYLPVTQNTFAANFTGINSIVYAYSGALLFIAFLSEMRQPMDFWKAMMCAQTFIACVYIFFGVFVYHYYGQYAYSVVNQSVLPVALQTVTNVLSLLTGWLAVFLYFNIGLKTVYTEVGREIFGFPAITTTKGKYLWWSLGPLYFIIAFIVAMSVPEFSAFTNFVGGLFSLNFTYSFSGVMYLCVKVQEGAALPGEGYDPATGVTTRHDSGMKRWVRGFMKGWVWTVPVLIFTLAGFAASGMGTWAAVLSLEAAFSSTGSRLTSWRCYNVYYTGG